MRARSWLVGLLVGTLAGCNTTAEEPLPPNVPDPATLQTPAGALARYRGAVARFRIPFEIALLRGAVLTDELVALPVPVGAVGVMTALDARLGLKASPGVDAYADLHKLRGQTREARGFLAAYISDSLFDLRAHLFALEGYAELFLADLFCSGVPLSTVDFDGDYTLAAGSTTEEVYEHAAMLLDSAKALAVDSARIRGVAAVGRGRALLSIGRYVDAMQAVADVPSGFTYTVTVPYVLVQTGAGTSLTPTLTGLSSYATNYGHARVPGTPSAADREGINGLDFRSSGDPRSRSVRLGAGSHGGDMYYPDTARFARTGAVTYVVANAVEARLIEAEALLMTGGDWLTKLNELRTNGTFTTQPNPGDPLITDTLWQAGTGGVAGLRPLDDPGAINLRLDLIMRERAFWLYFTGHRQADLRRFVRLYQRDPDSVYPVGSYAGGSGSYGSEFILPVPDTEQQYNTNYTGCFHRNS